MCVFASVPGRDGGQVSVADNFADLREIWAFQVDRGSAHCHWGLHDGADRDDPLLSARRVSPSGRVWLRSCGGRAGVRKQHDPNRSLPAQLRVSKAKASRDPPTRVGGGQVQRMLCQGHDPCPGKPRVLPLLPQG